MCLVDRVKKSTAYEFILEKWINSSHSNVINIMYYIESSKMFQGAIRFSPFTWQRYICLYEPWLSYEDYCNTLMYTKYTKRVWLMFECSSMSNPCNHWSPWFKTLLHDWCPMEGIFWTIRKNEFIDYLREDIRTIAQSEAWFFFQIEHLFHT